MRNPLRGVTWVEALTALVALVVLVAAAVPLWRVHELRSRREDAVKLLLAVQSAEDKHFGENARYADAVRLPTAPSSAHFQLRIDVSDDQLGYVATATALQSGPRFDARCQVFTLDQHGRRGARDDQGNDRSADCWNPG